MRTPSLVTPRLPSSPPHLGFFPKAPFPRSSGMFPELNNLLDTAPDRPEQVRGRAGRGGAWCRGASGIQRVRPGGSGTPASCPGVSGSCSLWRAARAWRGDSGPREGGFVGLAFSHRPRHPFKPQESLAHPLPSFPVCVRETLYVLTRVRVPGSLNRLEEMGASQRSSRAQLPRFPEPPGFHRPLPPRMCSFCSATPGSRVFTLSHSRTPRSPFSRISAFLHNLVLLMK